MSLFTYSGELLQVVDGDTVDLDLDLGFGVHVRERFRICGIDAPELHSVDKEERQRGEDARDFLLSLLVGTELHVSSQKTEKYGRWLCTLAANGEDVAEAMLKGGHARPYFGGKR